MATIIKHNDFVEQVGHGVHHFGPTPDTFKVVLSNTAPTANSAILGDITQIAAGNGYVSGGTAVTTITESETTGALTVQGTSVTFTASGGSIGPFQYYSLYNDSVSTPVVKPLVMSWNHGSAVTLADGESFTIKFNNASPGTIFTMAQA